MVIGINCIEIDATYSGGINSFTYGLLDGFAKTGKEHSFNVFVTQKNKHCFEYFLKLKNFKLLEVELPNSFFIGIEWKSIKLHSNAIYRFCRNIIYRKQIKFINKNCDILYTPTTTLFGYNNSVPTVLSMHDIQHTHFPSFFSPIELLIRNITYNLSAKYSDYLQASSTYIKEDFLKYFRFLKANNIILINEGVDIEKFQNARDGSLDILKKYNIPADFLFYPAQLWPHKNHITILKALLLLQEKKNRTFPLVLTGAKYSASDEVFSFINNNKMQNIYYLGKIPFDDIVLLYKHAKFLITASLHESSCLPVLESAASGVPIIASNIPPNIEMNKSIEMNLFPVNDFYLLGELIESLWDKKEFIDLQIKNNYRVVQKYSWVKIAEEYIAFFQKIFAREAF